MTAMSNLGRLLALVLVGMGVAITVKTLQQVGVERLALGHLVGPGLVAAGLARLKLQRMLEAGRDDEQGGGGDGSAP